MKGVLVLFAFPQNKLQVRVGAPPNSDAFVWEHGKDFKFRHSEVLSKLKPFGPLLRKMLLDS